MSDGPPPQLLEMIGNLSEFHREHEKFYAQAPLRQAVEVEAASRVLKALADRWSSVSPVDRPVTAPFAGAPDLNAPGLTAESGVLFMEGEGEPTEIKQLRRDLETLAGDMEAGGQWLGAAMEKGWAIAGSLAAFPEFADLLGERHRIIANDWQAADAQSLIARLIHRALEIIGRVDFSPEALRQDLAGERSSAAYLYSASELLDRAADVAVYSASLVHDNERRWRTFSDRVRQLTPSDQ
ncbi:MAG: hypothetical protein K0R41_68 [Geminicoccaceae bacterium]|jgi:hypothetical protein|nr:hypothetical protein [Geminicoccaceae bacterium]